MLINRYSTFVKDIEPKGFDLITIDGFLARESINSVKTVLYSADRRQQMVNHNYRNATIHYSYSVLQKRLAFIVENIIGDNCSPLGPDLNDRQRLPLHLKEKAPARMAS